MVITASCSWGSGTAVLSGMSTRTPATLKKSFDADLSSQHEHHLAGVDLRRSVYRGGAGVGPLPVSGVALYHQCRSGETAAGTVQPSAPRHRARHRLPLLPYLGRAVEFRGYSSDQDLHELPFADLDERIHARTRARQLSQRAVVAVDARQPAPGLRFLQSQHSHQ